MGASFSIDFEGGGLADMVRALSSSFMNPAEPAARAAAYITGQTVRAFERGGLVGRWAELSLLTRFVRAHRRSAPNKTALPLQDTGRLKGSFLPFSSDDGLEFGAATNVEYAQFMQEGGVSEGGDVEIGPYRRRRAGVTTAAEMRAATARGGAAKRAARAFGTVLVRGYAMKIKPAQVPARPFFPRDASELQALGYMDQVYKIWRDYFSSGGEGLP